MGFQDFQAKLYPIKKSFHCRFKQYTCVVLLKNQEVPMQAISNIVLQCLMMWRRMREMTRVPQVPEEFCQENEYFIPEAGLGAGEEAAAMDPPGDIMEVEPEGDILASWLRM